MTRIVVADDDTLLGDLVATLFAPADDLEVVSVAADGEEAMAAVARCRPDLLLLDVNLPVCDGWEVLTRLRRQRSPVRVVIMSVDYSEQLVRRARALGAAEYLDKREAARRLRSVLRRVAAGESWFQRHPPGSIRAAMEPDPGSSDPLELVEDLTERQRSVARCICEGKSNQEIALELAISLHTAKAHVSQILWKLGAQNRADAARLIVQRRLLPRK
jgi:DNA-binding NarL/FixJ family response regulator